MISWLRDSFGPDKCFLRMTLSEALRDDIVALKTGAFALLPRRDVSGRHLMYIVPHNHTGEGYTSDSMVRLHCDSLGEFCLIGFSHNLGLTHITVIQMRAIWYLMEIAVQESGCLASGFICLVWDKDSTIFDYDPKVFFRMTYFYCNCWPTKHLSMHGCCPPRVLLRMFKPIFFAILNKEVRSRAQIHNVPESQIVEALSQYGILKDMLPTEMGGTVKLNVVDWIASRRFIEMEEIH